MVWAFFGTKPGSPRLVKSKQISISLCVAFSVLLALMDNVNRMFDGCPSDKIKMSLAIRVVG